MGLCVLVLGLGVLVLTLPGATVSVSVRLATTTPSPWDGRHDRARVREMERNGVEWGNLYMINLMTGGH